MHGERVLGELFKKMLIYGSKIEELRTKLFLNNPDFNLLGIFNIYDENQNGHISLEEMGRLMNDMGLDLDEDKFGFFLRYLQDGWSKDSSLELKFAQFAKLFCPASHLLNFHLFDQFYERRGDFQNLHIEQSDFETMKEILVLSIVKLGELQGLVLEMKKADLDELFQLVSNGKLEIFLSDIKSFLELNAITYLEEDLSFIVGEFKTHYKSKVSYKEF